MKKYIISLIAILASTSVFSQEAKKDKPISIELIIRYERVEFNSNTNLGIKCRIKIR